MEIMDLIVFSGYLFILFLIILFFGFMLWISYFIYDYWLKKILGWKNIQVRRDIFYFIKHKKEIQEYIRNKRNGKRNQ